jgi:hypothetical protein
MELTKDTVNPAIYEINCVIPVFIVSARFREILLGKPRFWTASFIWVMFMVELPVAACCKEPKKDPAMITNWLKVKYNNKITGTANMIIPKNTDKVSFLI